MTRSARRRRDRVTVDQLLRETGAIPRKLESGPRSADRPPRDPFGRERVERRVEEASGPRRIGPRTRRRVLFSGVGVMAGGLVLLALASGRTPADQATLPFVPLAPATSSKPEVTEEPPAVISATPSPVVMSATQKKPRIVIPPAPVITTDVPPPSTSTPVTTVTLGDPYGGNCYNYPYCGGYGGGHHR